MHFYYLLILFDCRYEGRFLTNDRNQIDANEEVNIVIRTRFD